MRVSLLGPTEVSGAGQPVSLGGPKQRSVLAILALSANRVVASERLIVGVWGEDAGEKTAGTLQVYISTLRRALKDAPGLTIVSRRPGYLLEVDPAAVDVHRFDALLTHGRERLAAGRPDEAAEALHTALGLWRGPALADLRDEPFAGPEVVRLEQARLAAVEERVEADLALGRHRELIGELETIVADNPLRERMWGQLMVALYRSDRQADAIATYARARRVLADELGIDPGPALRELERAVLAQDLPVTAPAGRTAGAPVVVRVPRPSGRLVGREDDLERLAALLADADERLITLTGPGGSGKTRLALALAQLSSDRFRGGVYFADLSAITDAALVRSEIATGLGSADDSIAGLAECLHDRDALIVLDTLEHLLAASTDIAALLSATSQLRLVVTSRIPLRLAGETEYFVSGLAVPPPHADLAVIGATSAAQLFVARARAIRADFTLGAGNAEDVAEICRRLDGLPLAIELAAARLRLLGVRAVRERLDASLTLLTSGHRDAPERQRTLRATIRWSVDLLAEAERAALGRLGLFSGSFDVDTALEILGGDGEGPLETLMSCSLVRRDGERFRMPEAVRQFAVDELGGHGDAASAAFVAHFVGAAEAAHAQADGPGAVAAAGAIEVDLHNFSAAIRLALARDDGESAARIAVGLTPTWPVLGRLTEARAYLDTIIAAAGTAAGGALHAAAGRLAYQQGDATAALRHFDLAESDPTGLRAGEAALVRCLRAAIALGSGDIDAGRTAAQRELERADAAGLYAPQVVALSVLAIAAAMTDDFAAERAHYERRLTLCRRHGDRVRTADTLTTLAEISFDAGDFAAATTLAREAFAISDGHIRPESRDALIMLGRVAVAEREPERAAGLLAEALQRAVEIGQPAALALSVRVHAAAAVVSGDLVRAARLFGAGTAMHPASVPFNPATEQDLAARRDECRELLGSAVFTNESERGAMLDAADIIALAAASRDERTTLAAS